MSVANEERVGLPPLSTAKRSTWERYRLEFLADGYPGRRVEGSLRPQPLYGTYVIGDYLAQHQQTQDASLLRAAVRVAEAALDRMDDLGKAAVFRYTAHTGVQGSGHGHYGALTQARYLAALGRLDQATGSDRFREAGKALLASLTLPVERGGVARATLGGHLAVEERSGELPAYTLSCWSAVTLMIDEYARTTGDDDARQVAEDSVRGIAELLPQYDVAELGLSRERLGGHASLRLSFSQPGARVLVGGLDVPGHGRFALDPDPTNRAANRWVSGLDEQGLLQRTTAGLDVVLCRATWPLPHTLRVEVEVGEACRYALKIGQGPYDPLAPAMRVEDWAVVLRGEVRPGGDVLEVPIPWHLADLVAYPTGFSRVVGDQRSNATHLEHVDTLRRLLKVRPEPAVEYYLHRWAAAPRRWATVPELQAVGLAVAGTEA